MSQLNYQQYLFHVLYANKAVNDITDRKSFLCKVENSL
jgi:hypothetical protein